MKIREYIRYAVMLLLFPATCCFVACDNEDYMRFDMAHSGVYFTKDTLNYSFGVMPVEIKEYTYNIPVKVLGGISKVKRPIAYTIDADSTNAEEGKHFTIGAPYILPDSIQGFIPVTVYRSSLEGNHKEGYTRYKLCIRLAENSYFTPTLDSLSQVRIFRFDNAINQPEWYNAHGDKVWQKDALGEWHPYKFIKMVEYFHAIEDIVPETYKKMVLLYGENLEHIPLGDPYQYRTIFVKHIYSPMYEYFSNPDNKSYIEEQFPDFPFDFPDPYKTNQG